MTPIGRNIDFSESLLLKLLPIFVVLLNCIFNLKSKSKFALSNIKKLRLLKFDKDQPPV